MKKGGKEPVPRLRRTNPDLRGLIETGYPMGENLLEQTKGDTAQAIQ